MNCDSLLEWVQEMLIPHVTELPYSDKIVFTIPFQIIKRATFSIKKETLGMTWEKLYKLGGGNDKKINC